MIQDQLWRSVRWGLCQVLGKSRGISWYNAIREADSSGLDLAALVRGALGGG